MTIPVRKITQCYTIWSLELQTHLKTRVLCRSGNRRNIDLIECCWWVPLLKLQWNQPLDLCQAWVSVCPGEGRSRIWRPEPLRTLHLGTQSTEISDCDELLLAFLCLHLWNILDILLGPTPQTQTQGVRRLRHFIDQPELGITEILTSPEDKVEC